jgi:hypothetical protein
MRATPFLALVALAALACNDSSKAKPSSDRLTGSAERRAMTPPPPPIEEGMAQQLGVVGSSAGMARPTSVIAADAAQSSPQAPTSRAAAVAGTAEIAPSMLIRTGSASIEVRELDPAIIKLRQLASQLGGYVANSSISGGRDQVRSAMLEIKIPAARYDQAVSGLGGVGKVESVNTNVEDVGEEYVDIAARVTNAKRLEERFVSLLATRTGRLQDVLAVERELARVREEIERYEGRLRFLRTRAAVSTLSVTVHEPMPILGQSPGENPIASALRQAWRNFVGFIAWLIASLGVLIPAGALIAGGWIVFKRIRGRKQT